MAAANSYWNAQHAKNGEMWDLPTWVPSPPPISANDCPSCSKGNACLNFWSHVRYAKEKKEMQTTTPLPTSISYAEDSQEDTELRQSCFSDAEYNAKRGCSLKRKAETQLDPVDSEELEEESLADELGDLADALWDLFKPRIEELVRQTLPNPRPIKPTPMESYVFKPPRSTGKRML